MRFKSPCVGCGEPVKANRCDQCRRDGDRRRIRKRRQRASPADRGYDQRWRNLSERARRMQPWCLDCGATEDLQADHSPEAWRRWERGLAIRLKDIDIVCGPCNRKRGQARGATSRSKPSSDQNDTDPHSSAEKQPQSHTEGGERGLAGHETDSPSARLFSRLHSQIVGQESQEVRHEGGS